MYLEMKKVENFSFKGRMIGYFLCSLEQFQKNPIPPETSGIGFYQC